RDFHVTGVQTCALPILPAMGVPAVHSGGGDLLGTREAKDAYALLRFLADPFDARALVAVLRSPYFAVDDPTLYRFAQAMDWLPRSEERRGGTEGTSDRR